MKTKSNPECKSTDSVANHTGHPTREKWVNEHLIKMLAVLSTTWKKLN